MVVNWPDEPESTAAPMQIADGYHRVCAGYPTGENTAIPRRLVSWQPQ